jgi:hypothetical protein
LYFRASRIAEISLNRSSGLNQLKGIDASLVWGWTDHACTAVGTTLLGSAATTQYRLLAEE